MNTFLTACMQWEGGASSSLVGFGGCGIVMEGCSMKLDSGFGVRRGYVMDC